MKRSALTRRIAIFSILVLAFVGTITALNVSLYSASGFVSSYLHALARHDVEGALGMAGVDGTGARATSANRALLAPTALAALTDIHLVSDVDAGGGQHDVTFRYRLGGVAGSSAFAVTHLQPRLGFFSAWSFISSPLSTLRVTALNDRRFTANGVDLVSPGPADTSTDLAVLIPARVTLAHRSDYFSAAAQTAVIDKTDSRVPAVVDVQANTAFVALVQKELNSSLDGCVAQKVLLPTGCPIGTQIADRIQDAPTWSMKTYPATTIVPGPTEGTWAVPSAKGVAHIVVTVKSIFDGTVSTVDKDVPFTVSYAISFSNGQLTIVASN